MAKKVAITSPEQGSPSVGLLATLAAIRQPLLDQLSSPVRWVETIRAIAARGADVVTEAGPGKVLAGLMKKIDRSLTEITVFDPASLESAMESINA
jgi:[acyl-carrier-protein] S-malonyltransferase